MLKVYTFLRAKSVKLILRLVPATFLFSIYKRLEDGRLKRRLWDHFLRHEATLPESARREVGNAKWSSEWFQHAWLSKPISLDHIEARHRMFTHLIKLCSQHPHITGMDDLGCCNGTFIRDAELILPHLQEFRGWEISDDAVTYLSERFRSAPKLKFHKTDLDQMFAHSERSVIVTSGTLQYMAEPELVEFLTRLAKQPSDVFLVISEISQFKLEDRPHSTLRVHETFNHSFTRLFPAAGFSILASETFAYKPNVDWVIYTAHKSAASPKGATN